MKPVPKWMSQDTLLFMYIPGRYKTMTHVSDTSIN